MHNILLILFRNSIVFLIQQSSYFCKDTMKNLTNYNKTSFNFRQGIWINEFVFECILVKVFLYLFIALIYHQVKVEKHKKVKFLQLTLERKYVVLSKYTCITIAVLSVIRSFNELSLSMLEGSAIFFNITKQHHNTVKIACNILPVIGGFAISFGNFFVYVFLWLRQSIFYVHSSLNFLYNTCLKVFSIFVLISYFLFGISLLSAYFIKVRYALNEFGICQFRVENDDDTSYLQILIAWNIASILIQISLLGLFIYPLLKQASWQKKLSMKGNKVKSTKNTRMLRRVKKAVTLASVCLLTDILTLAAVSLAFEKNANNTSVMYDINLAINFLVTIVCFDYWKKLLWPWNTKCLTIPVSALDEASSWSQQTTANRNSFSVATITTV